MHNHEKRHQNISNYDEEIAHSFNDLNINRSVLRGHRSVMFWSKFFTNPLATPDVQPVLVRVGIYHLLRVLLIIRLLR